MKSKNTLKLKINNKNQYLEKYLKPQWTWKTYIFMGTLLTILTLVVIDLEINFIELFSESSKYFVDILNRMLPPDFQILKI